MILAHTVDGPGRARRPHALDPTHACTLKVMRAQNASMFRLDLLWQCTTGPASAARAARLGNFFGPWL
jgi:hypothetical protein